MPTAAPVLDLTKHMPTGFESQQSRIAAKQKLAQMMLERGLREDPMVSPVQVLGRMAQTWAGKSGEDDAAKMQDRLATDVMAARQARRAALFSDAKTLPLSEVAQKYGADPLLAEDVKPWMEAYQTSLKNDQGYVAGDPFHRRHGDIPQGQYMPPDPTKSDLVLDPATGRLVPNGLLIGAKVASQGLPVAVPGANGQPQSLYPQSAPAPTMPGQAAPGQDISLLNPEERRILVEELQRRRGLPTEALGAQAPNSATPPPSGLVDGKPYWIRNGKVYDNPLEGQ